MPMALDLKRSVPGPCGGEYFTLRTARGTMLRKVITIGPTPSGPMTNTSVIVRQLGLFTAQISTDAA